MLLTIAGLLGFLSVAIGAYSEHGLRSRVSDEVFRFLMTAVRYNQVHALMMAAIGLAGVLTPHELPTSAALAGWGFGLGTLLFSGSIYASAMMNRPGLTKLAPAGGTVLMAAWLTLAWTGLSDLV